jgi:hypothetical protein
MKQSAFIAIGFLILLLALSACTPAPLRPAPTVTSSPTSIPATATPLPSATATPHITATLISTATPIPFTPTPTPVDSGVLTPLAPLPASVTQVEMGFADRWFTYLRVDEPPAPSSLAATLFVLDSQTATSWEVTTACLDTNCEFAWTSTGQLVWLENGAVFLADADGQNKRNLNAPSIITEIFGISATDVAILRGSNGTDLWRLYLPDGTFDAIPEPQRNRDPIPEFITRNDLLYFTADNTIAGLAYDTTDQTWEADIHILAVPLQAETVPTLLATPTTLYYLGRSGPFPLPPLSLPRTPYWLGTEIAALYENTPPFHYVVDIRTQTLDSLEHLIGLEQKDYLIRKWDLFADRSQLLVHLEPVNPSIAEPRYNAYVAPVTDLQSGNYLFIEGGFVGWYERSDALLVMVRQPQSNTLSWLSLKDGSQKTLFPNLGIYDYPSMLETQEAFFVQPSRFMQEVVVISPQSIVTARTNIPVRIIANFNEGDPWGQRIDPVYAIDRHAYYVAGAPDLAEPDEQAYLWRWDVNEK